MGSLIPERQVIDKRLQRFLAIIRDVCRSSTSFKQKIDVQIGLIAWRAAETGSDVRNAISNERIASVILSGRVNQGQCKMVNPVELAIEGRFTELGVVAFNPVREIKMENVGVRVVVREGSSKHIVVTVNHLKAKDTDILSLPEVQHVVW
jgi:hypothetical protein